MEDRSLCCRTGFSMDGTFVTAELAHRGLPCAVKVLRTVIGGWRRDFPDAIQSYVFFASFCQVVVAPSPSTIDRFFVKMLLRLQRFSRRITHTSPSLVPRYPRD